MDRRTLQVPGMHCGGCARRIEDALKHVEGVRRVKADFMTHTVDVAFDSEKVDETTVRSVIEKAGYEVIT